jgi:hypothetical protein
LVSDELNISLLVSELLLNGLARNCFRRINLRS